MYRGVIPIPIQKLFSIFVLSGKNRTVQAGFHIVTSFKNCFLVTEMHLNFEELVACSLCWKVSGGESSLCFLSFCSACLFRCGFVFKVTLWLLAFQLLPLHPEERQKCREWKRYPPRWSRPFDRIFPKVLMASTYILFTTPNIKGIGREVSP